MLHIAQRTGINQFLLRGLPSFLLGNLFFNLANLSSHSGKPRTGSDAAMAGSWATAGTSLTVSVGSASMVNFCCLRSWIRQSCQRGGTSKRKKQGKATDSESKLHLDATTDSEAASLRRGDALSVCRRQEDRKGLKGSWWDCCGESQVDSSRSREAGDGNDDDDEAARCLPCWPGPPR